MYYDFRVPIPDAKDKIYPQERNGVTYVQYEYNYSQESILAIDEWKKGNIDA